MKKYLMLLTVAAAIATTSFAQNKDKEGKEEKHEKNDHLIVPEAVKMAFAKQYPGATAKWEKEHGSYEAGFKSMGHEMSALFEANGSLTESEMEIESSELPAIVIAYVREHHNGAAITESAKITKSNGEVNYETEVKGKDLIFDANGKFLKEEKD